MVGIHHEQAPVAHRLGHGLAKAHVIARAQPHLHRGRGEAHVEDRCGFIPKPHHVIGHAFTFQHHAVAIGAHPVTMRPADQLVQRQACHFACNIPKRDVHTRQGLHWHAFLPVIAQQVVNLVPDHVAVQRVVVQHHGLDHLFHDPLICQRHVARTKTFAPAGDAVVGLHLNQMGGATGIVLLGIAQFFGQVVLQHVAVYGGDLHGAVTSAIRPGRSAKR